MATLISNSAQYAMVMGRAGSKAMDYCLKKLHVDLMKYTEVHLYGAYSPETYPRTMGILNAWREAAKGWAFGELYMIPPQPINRGTGAHISISPNYGTLGTSLLDVLEAGYGAYNAHVGKAIPARPFFTKWIQNRASKYAGAWWRDGMEQLGFKITGR